MRPSLLMVIRDAIELRGRALVDLTDDEVEEIEEYTNFKCEPRGEKRDSGYRLYAVTKRKGATLIDGQCPECFALNSHEPSCSRRKA